MQDRQDSRLGRLIRFGDQIAGAPLFADALEVAEVLHELVGARAGGLPGDGHQPLQLGRVQVRVPQAEVGAAVGLAHSSSRGRPARTLPRPKNRPNWRSYTSSSSWVSTSRGPWARATQSRP